MSKYFAITQSFLLLSLHTMSAPMTPRRRMADEAKDALEAKRATPKPDDTSYYASLVDGVRDRIMECIKFVINKRKHDEHEPQAVNIPLADLGWPMQLISSQSQQETEFETFVKAYFNDHEGLAVSFQYPVFGYSKTVEWLHIIFNGPKTHMTEIVSFKDLPVKQ